ncbi:hypothetical protein CSA08_02100 [Candidatus Gracilibacteria bacterium]|nr:MAG: hypothetical protein CSA08_02100 [Candidatus Gracilibacteria bacterium]
MADQIYKKDRLKDYGIWYYLRYYPSKNKLREKLLLKSNNNFELSDEVINDMKNIINEEEVLKSKIRMFLDRNKNVSYIKNNLRQKKFDLEMINNILSSDFFIEEKCLLKKSFVLKKVLDYKLKGKSILYIRNRLIDRPIDRGLVEECIKEIFVDGELEQIKMEFDKIKNKYPKEKCIQKLITKGFIYSQIKEVVEL